MNKKLPILIASLSCLAATAQAAVIFSDNFDAYSAGTITGANGGTGFSDAWASSGVANVGTNNFGASVPTNYTLPTSANSVTINGNGTSPTASRTLSSSIDLNPVSATTYYFSYLYSRTDTGNTGGGEQTRLSFRDSTGVEQFSFGFSSTEHPEILGQGGAVLGTGSTAITVNSNAFSTAAKYLVVGKVTLGAGATDSLSMKVYNSTDTISGEPVTWDVSVSGATIGGIQSTVDIIRLAGASGSQLTTFDNVIGGTTFADVTAIPEPSSFAALAGLSMLGLAATRRRRAI